MTVRSILWRHYDSLGRLPHTTTSNHRPPEPSSIATSPTPIATTPKRRFVMTPRRWVTLSAICFLAAAYYLCYEHFPVHVTKGTPLYRATRNGKQGIVTTGGRIVVPFEWDEIGTFDDAGMAKVAVNQPPVHLHISDPMIGRFIYQTSRGIISHEGKVIIPATLTDSSWGFDEHGEFQGVQDQQLINFDRSGKEKWRSDWLPVDHCRFGKNGLMAVQKGDQTGWMDRTGQIRLRPPRGLLAASNFEECGLALVSSDEGLFGCVDERGMIIIPTEWTEITFHADTIDGNGKRVIADPMLVRVSLGPKAKPSDQVSGYYSLNGQCIVPAKYFDTGICYEKKLIYGRHLDGIYRALDFGGKPLPLLSELEDLELVTGVDLIAAKREGKYGWLDQQGQAAINFEYDAVLFRTSFRDNQFAIVAKNDRWGVIDREGQIVVPFEFDRISDSLIHHKLFVASKDKQQGCLDASGKTVIPFEFFSLGDTTTNEYFVGSKKGEEILFDTHGRQLRSVNGLTFARLRKQLGPIRLRSHSHMVEVLRPADSFLAAVDQTTDGAGVFHVTRGIIVPLVHYRVAFVGNGLEGRGLMRPDSSFDRYSAFAIEKFSEWMPSTVPPANEVHVIYDLDGNVIWRNDARLFDFLKAFGLSCWGLYCFRRYRIAKREQRMMQAV